MTFPLIQPTPVQLHRGVPPAQPWATLALAKASQLLKLALIANIASVAARLHYSSALSDSITQELRNLLQCFCGPIFCQGRRIVVYLVHNIIHAITNCALGAGVISHACDIYFKGEEIQERFIPLVLEFCLTLLADGIFGSGEMGLIGIRFPDASSKNAEQKNKAICDASLLVHCFQRPICPFDRMNRQHLLINIKKAVDLQGYI